MKISSEECLKYDDAYQHRSYIANAIKKINSYKTDMGAIRNILIAPNNNNSIKSILSKLDWVKYWESYLSSTSTLLTDIDEILSLLEKYTEERYTEVFSDVNEFEITWELTCKNIAKGTFFWDILFGSEKKVIFTWKVSVKDIWDTVIKNCIFKSEIAFLNAGSGQYASFNDCTFETDYKYEDFNKWGNHYWGVILKNSNFKNLSFKDSVFDELKIEFDEKFEAKEWYQNSILIERWSFNKIKIYWGDTNKVKIWEINISHCKFSKESEVFLCNIEIGKFLINSTTNLTDAFKITNVKVNAEFDIEDVDFWKVIFNGLDLSSATLNFKHPTFNNCIFNSVTWKDNCDIKNDNDKELRDIYRQMKFVMDKSWDSIIWSKFYRNEMVTQKRLLKDATIWERVVFWFWYLVNNFGQSWARPLLILFFLNFVLWILEYKNSIEIDFSLATQVLDKTFWNNFYFNFSSYVSYLTPFRKLSDYPTIWDSLARILSGLLIYQSAIAMRRKIER